MTPIPLFPLQQALFPDGVLHLQVFEVRYLHMVRRCLEEGAPFGVVGLLAGDEVRKPDSKEVLAAAGCLARIESSEAVMPGLMRLVCRGDGRFRLVAASQGPYGLWMGEIERLAPDPPLSIAPHLQRCADFLGRTIANWQKQAIERLPVAPPFLLDDAGWVANRLGELLPIAMEQRQALLVMPDPQQRLQWIDRWLDEQGAWA